MVTTTRRSWCLIIVGLATVAILIGLSVGCLPADAPACQPGGLYGPDNVSGKLLGWLICSGK